MKTKRFCTVPIESEIITPTSDNKVKFDNELGHIMYKEGDKSWSLTDTGHMLTERGITSHTGNGLLTRSSGTESNGLQVFTGTEHLLTIREKDGSISSEYVRDRLGLQGGCELLITNTRVFLVKNYSRQIPVSYDREINTVELHRTATLAEKLQNLIGYDECIVEGKSIIDSINNLARAISTQRTLIGGINYLFYNDDTILTVTPKDKDIAFNHSAQRFMYYSAALQEWVYLQKGWERLSRIERFEAEFDKTQNDLEVGWTIGFIDTGNTYEQTAEGLIQISPPVSQIGDEHIVQWIQFNDKLYSGRITYTRKGWIWRIS